MQLLRDRTRHLPAAVVDTRLPEPWLHVLTSRLDFGLGLGPLVWARVRLQMLRRNGTLPGARTGHEKVGKPQFELTVCFEFPLQQSALCSL